MGIVSFASKILVVLWVAAWRANSLAQEGPNIAEARASVAATRNDVRLVPQTGFIVKLSFSPDGKRAVTCGLDNVARLWDVGSWALIRTLKGHSSWVVNAAFSPDGTRIATASADMTVKLWDATNGNLTKTFIGSPNGLSAVCFSPDGSQVAFAGGGKDIAIRSISGPISRTLVGSFNDVQSVCYSPDGKWILAAALDGLTLWNASTGAISRTLPISVAGGLFGQGATFSPNGQEILCPCADNSARLWNAGTGALTRTFVGHSESVGDAAFSPNGKQVVTASDDRTAKIWNASTGVLIRTLVGHRDKVDLAAFSPDGKQIVTTSDDATIKFWDASTGELLRTPFVSSMLSRGVAFSPDGREVATANQDGAATLWNLESGLLSMRFKGHSGSLGSVAFSPDGRRIVTASDDQTAKIWDTSSGRLTKTLSGHLGAVDSACFSPAGDRVVTASDDGKIKIWDASSGATLKTLHTSNSPNGATFSPDGSKVLISTEAEAEIWDTTTGTLVRRISGSDSSQGAAFAPSGAEVVTANRDGVTTIWDVASGAAIKVLKGSPGLVAGALFSPDGHRILSWDNDGAKLWERPSSTLLRTQPAAAWIISASFSPEGSRIITANSDGALKLLDAASGKELCSLLSFNDGTWAVVDPSGRYDGSNTGHVSGLHWVKGNEPIDLDQFRDFFYCPGLLAKIFAAQPLPRVPDLNSIGLFPESSVRVQGDRAIVTLKNRGGGIGKVYVLLNGQEIARYNADKVDFDKGSLMKTLTVSLSGLPRLGEGKDQISVLAYNAEGSLRSRGSASNAPPGAETPPTAYYAVIAATQHYSNPGLNLKYAAADAVSIARAVQSAGEGLGVKPTIYLLCDSAQAKKMASDTVTVMDPTRENFDRVFAELGSNGRVKSQDLLLLYLSGHGVAIQGDEKHYAYLTKDAVGADQEDLANPVIRKLYCLTDDDISDYLRPIAARKRVLILDTCYAGTFKAAAAGIKGASDPTAAALDLGDRTGVHVLLASAANRSAYEGPVKHGFLTYSLLWAMKTEPLGDTDNPDAVQVDKLFDEAQRQTEAISRRFGLPQRPQILSGNGESFPIGFLNRDRRENIALEANLPLIRIVGIGGPTGLVDASLSDDVKNDFRDILAGRPNGEAVAEYVDEDGPEVITLNGKYTQVSGKLSITLVLSRAGKVLKSLLLEATPADAARSIAASVLAFIGVNH